MDPFGDSMLPPPMPMMGMPDLGDLPLLDLSPPSIMMGGPDLPSGPDDIGPPSDYVEEKVNLNGDTVRKEVHTVNGVTEVHVEMHSADGK